MADVKVLSIDGGGIRGVIPARMLAELEDRLGVPLSTHFDLIAGTSTGAIIAAALCTDDPDTGEPFRASKILEFYENRGPTIFPHHSRNLFRRLQYFFHKERFDGKILRHELGRAFKRLSLSDANRSFLLVAAFNIQQGNPKFFKSWRAQGLGLDTEPDRVFDAKTYDFLLADVLHASAAAPTFFDPVTINNALGEPLDLVDGGVFASNPSACALASAIRIFNLKNDLDKIMLASFGTGYDRASIETRDARHWGDKNWARPLVKLCMDGSHQAADYQVATSLSHDNYFRFDMDLAKYREEWPVSSPSTSFTDGRSKNISALKRAAQHMIDTSHKELFDRLVGVLQS